jgi:thiol-disulfide isomerase/thioredoxin
MTWLLAGIAAALLNIPNFDAKKVGQECDCAITPYLGELDIHVEITGLLISVWILIPAIVFSFLSLISIFRTPSWIMDRRSYYKGLKRSVYFGEIIGIIAVTIILAEASLTNSIIVYPNSNENNLSVAENFGMLLTNGTIVDLYDFNGKPTLLEFMWTQCSHCQNMMPTLKSINEQYGSEINMISVSVEWGNDDLDALLEFDDEYGTTWLSALDKDGGTDKYGASSVPRLFLIDEEFNIIYSELGEVSLDTLLTEINSLLNNG